MSVSERLKEYFAPQPIDQGVRVRDVVRELPSGAKKVAGGIKDFAVDAAQSTARGAVATPFLTAQRNFARTTNRLFGTNVVKELPEESPTDTNAFTKAVFGGKPIRSLGKYGQGGLDWIDETRSLVAGKEVTPTPSALAIPAGIVGVAMETPIFKGPKKAFELADDVVDLLAKTKNIKEVESTLIKNGVDKVTAKEMSTQVAQANTRQEVKSVFDSLQERGFATSVKEAIPNAPVNAPKMLVRSTDDLAIKARNLVTDNLDEAERIAKTGSDEVAVAVASELMKKYADDAVRATSKVEADRLYDKVAEIANDIVPKLTASARTVQAASILGRMTPEGQLRFAARTINNYNEANPTRKIKELSKEDTEYILKEMKEIEAMPDSYEKALRFDKLQKYTLSKIPTPLWKKITTTWQASLLTGLKTTGINLGSSAFNIVGQTAARVPAVIIDSVVSLLTGKRSVALSTGVTLKGVKQGFDKGVKYFKTGFDERNVEEGLNFNRVNFGQGKVGKLFQVYTDTVFRTMGATDQFFYYGVLAASIKEQAVVRAINTGRRGDKNYINFLTENPDEQMMTYAVIDALTATFQNKTALGEALSNVRRSTGAAGEIAIPFARTPAAAAMEVIHYTPIGALEAAWPLIRRGEFDQRKFSTLMGKSIMGTAGAGWLGYKLYEEGKVTLSYPNSERERRMWEAEGRKANSIFVNGKWRQPGVLGPNGIVLLWGAHLNKALKEYGSVSEAALNASLGMGQSFLDQTALTGISAMTEAISNPSEMGPSYIAGLVSSFVPTIVSDIAKTTDEYERDTQGTGVKEKVVNRTMARIPGVRENLPIKVDVYGYDIKRIGNMFEAMADPTRPSKQFDSPIMTEVRRLHEEGFQAAPTKIDRYETLTPEQQLNLYRLAGTLTEDRLTELMQKTEYRLADDEKRAQLIDTKMTSAKVDARAIMLSFILQEVPAAKRNERIAELWDVGMVTEAVYSRYKEIR